MKTRTTYRPINHTFSISLACLLAFLLTTSSCGKNEREKERVVKGGVKYGGAINLSESQFIGSLYPLSLKSTNASRVAYQIYDGLFKLDQNALEIRPNLVKNYSSNESNTVYTFELKPDIYFHDNQCFKNKEQRLLTSEDIAFCLRNLLTPSPEKNVPFAYVSLFKNGAYFYDNVLTNPELKLEALKVIDEYKFKIFLSKPSPNFPLILTSSQFLIYPKEAYDAYLNSQPLKAIGTGPFMVDEIEVDDKLTLKRNPDYHGFDEFGNQLPYLDELSIKFILDRSVALRSFENGSLDVLDDIPNEALLKIMKDDYNQSGNGYDQYNFQRSPEYATQFLGFDNQNPFLAQKSLRKAISFALNREALVENTLKGAAIMAGKKGICPPAMSEDFDKVNGYTYNLDSAKHYFQQVLMPKGERNIRLSFFAPGDELGKNKVASEIKRQIESTLDIKVILKCMPKELMMTRLKNEGADILLSELRAEFPESFALLAPFYGRENEVLGGNPKRSNLFAYYHPGFNKALDKAISTSNNAIAANYYLEAQNILMEDAPIAVLWYSEGYQLLQPLVRNLPASAVQYPDFSKVYLDKPETLRDSNL